MQLDYLRRRLASRNLKLEVSDAAERLLAEEGYNHTYDRETLTVKMIAED